MSLHGSIETFAIADVLRLLAATSKSGRLTVQGPTRTGTIWLDSAQILAAESPSTPHVRGPVDVVFQTIRFDSGSFRFEVDKYPPEPGEPVAIDHALDLSRNMLEEWRGLCEHIQSTDAWVELNADLDGERVSLAMEEWRTLVAVGGGHSVAEIGDLLTLGELPTYRLVARVLDMGLVTIGSRPLSTGTTSTIPASVPGATTNVNAPPPISMPWTPPFDSPPAPAEAPQPTFTNGTPSPTPANPTWTPEPASPRGSADIGGYDPAPLPAPPPPAPQGEYTYPLAEDVGKPSTEEYTYPPSTGTWERPGGAGGSAPAPPAPPIYPPTAPRSVPGAAPPAPPPPPPDSGSARNGPTGEVAWRNRTDSTTSGNTAVVDIDSADDVTGADPTSAPDPDRDSQDHSEVRNGSPARAVRTAEDAGWLGSLADAIQRADASDADTSLASRFGSPGAPSPLPVPSAPPVTWASASSLLEGNTPERLAPPPPPPPPGAGTGTLPPDTSRSDPSSGGDVVDVGRGDVVDIGRVEEGTAGLDDDIERQLANLSPRAREAVKQSTGLFDGRSAR